MNAPAGSLAVALGHGERLLAAAPAMAVRQACEILAVVPGEAAALGLLARALGRAPDDPDGWRTLADARFAAGDGAGADAAYMAAVRAAVHDPAMREAGAALAAGRIAVAEPILRTRLKQAPTDVAAMRMLAEIAGRLGRYADAEALLARAVELAPGFAAARHNLALMLYRQNKAADALPHLERLLADAPDDAGLRNLHAAALGQVGEYDRAVAIWEALLAQHPDQPKAWMSYGHALKTVGRAADSADAYARAVALEPGLGEAWWSLANLKTWRFDAAQIARMQALLADTLEDEDRLHLEFTLGKAAEDAGDPERAFGHYARGNAIVNARGGYDPRETARLAERSAALFTPAFFAARADGGDPAPDPLFIVGMPRAGSTLIEQILASHPHGRRHDGAARNGGDRAAARPQGQALSRCARRTHARRAHRARPRISRAYAHLPQNRPAVFHRQDA